MDHTQVQVTDSPRNSIFETDDAPVHVPYVAVPILGGPVQMARLYQAFNVTLRRRQTLMVAAEMQQPVSPEDAALANLFGEREDDEDEDYGDEDEDYGDDVMVSAQQTTRRVEVRYAMGVISYWKVVDRIPRASAQVPASQDQPAPPNPKKDWMLPEQKRYPKGKRVIVDLRPSRAPERHARRQLTDKPLTAPVLAKAICANAACRKAFTPPAKYPDAKFCPECHSAHRAKQAERHMETTTVRTNDPICAQCREKFHPPSYAPKAKFCPRCHAAQKAKEAEGRLSPMDRAIRDLRAERELRTREDAEIRDAVRSGKPLPEGAKYGRKSGTNVALVLYKGRSITVHVG